jgi:hypothetical protein
MSRSGRHDDVVIKEKERGGLRRGMHHRHSPCLLITGCYANRSVASFAAMHNNMFSIFH